MPAATGLSHFRKKWRRRRERNFRENVWSEMGRALRGQLYVDLGAGPEASTYLAGHDRSGTTWIAQVLNYDHRYRYIYEPFHPGRLRVARVFSPRQYLRPSNDEPAYVEAARAILSGKTRSLWGDKYNRRVLPRRRLIKEVRSNLLLPWLHRHFPQMPIILIVRHPCAVVHSQRRLSSAWKVELSRFLSQDDLMADYLAPFRADIEGAETDFEQMVFVWCIENHVPLQHFEAGQIHLTFYENFCLDPAGEAKALFQFLGEPFDERSMTRVAEPSLTSQRDSAILSGQDLVGAWRSGVTPEERRRAVEILSLFGLDRYYSEDPMPRVASGRAQP